MKSITTGTKISFLFALFSFWISFFLLAFINIYSTINWYQWEKNEIVSKLNQQVKEISEEKSFQEQKQKLINELAEKWWFIWINNDYKHIIYDIYEKNGLQYFLFYIQTPFWNITLPYNGTSYIQNQIHLIYISFIGLIIFSIWSFFLAKILFIRFALKNIFLMSKALQNIDFENIQPLDVMVPKDDEIYSIIENINRFLTLIDQNTQNLKSFNSQVSHEFKTPLMVISTQIEYAQITHKYEESFVKIEKQINILNELLETFLLISKVQNNNMIWSPEKVNLTQIIKYLTTQFQNIYKEKEIFIHFDSKKNIFVYTDINLLSLVMKNIIENAFKYTQKKGQIDISITETSIIIQDNGIGMTKETLANIFNNFYRESNNEKWYWIWLNIVKKIIDILNYTITIKSEKWVGSEFIIYFNK